MRYSKQREEILKVVTQACDHPDALMIYERIRKIIPNVSLGTVYRNLNSLVEQGCVRRIPMKDGNDRFDKTVINHNHLYCERCGKVVDIDFDIPTEEIAKIEGETDFKITNGSFKINGLCGPCRNERKD
ncbi:MAG: transcriptional repressor [Bacilli bacterium]|jgi:transcriptional regulator, fur family|nr:transcriptional repressor [Bacilli bacterium]